MSIIIFLIAFYLSFEVMLSLAFRKPFLLSGTIHDIIKYNFNKKFGCSVGSHNWKSSSVVIEYNELPKPMNRVTLYTRVCTGKCKRRQYSYSHPLSRMFRGWREGNPPPPETAILKKKR